MPSPTYIPALRAWMRDFYRLYRRRVPFALIWLGLIAAFYLILASTPLTLREIAVLVFTTMTTSWWAPLAFLGAYVVRTILLIPISLFSLASGLLFGLGVGIVIAYAGAVLSALIAYAMGYWLRGTPLADEATNAFTRLLQRRPFEVILGTHLTLLPYDLVNVISGMLRAHGPAFVLAVLIGLLPGILSLVSLGASIDFEQFLTDGLSIGIFDWRYLLFSAVVFVVSVLGARWYRNRSSR